MRADVIVIGGGHAGCEAASAAARMGALVILLTMRRDMIGAMSCNPAIGGIGKGHLVREVDVFDGIIAPAADQAAIHYRMLNASKGVAVHGPRIQADRRRYCSAVARMIAAHPKIMIVEGKATRLVIEADRLRAVVLADNDRIEAAAVVIAAGTFLSGRLHCGEEQKDGGRVGESSATSLGGQLREFAPVARLKTGTPPRLDGRTIDWSRLPRQASDMRPWTMSPLSRRRALPQVACGVTRTTMQTHDLIRAALHRSPIHTGAIVAGGPRYCPSIEDKVARFGDRDGHQIFLEPEGIDDPTVYPNGISTSLPRDVQQAVIASIPGLERTAIVQPGYAVEYDYLDPRALDRQLTVRGLAGLFCAGQINGTTGYEEAAAQGLVAGLNAAAHALGRAPIWFERHDSYIGVMIDDLTLQGVTEPYRMLTARAEYRLHLRADNAHDRLGDVAERLGILSEERRAYLAETRLGKARIAEYLDTVTRPGSAIEPFEHANDIDLAGSIAQHLDVELALAEEVLSDRLYAPYVARQQAEIAARRASTAVSLATISCFTDVRGLSNEMVERLNASRPATIDDASRIRGITPAALTAIMVAARRAA